MRRRVAVKVLPDAGAEDPSIFQRFQREARAGATLDHPNIVRVFDVDEDEKRHFLVMEYIDGLSLHDLVAGNGPMDVALACNYVRQAAEGLQHAHEKGLIHRDVKPSNILVTPRDQVKVCDLGLALIEGEEIEDHTVVGGKGYVVGSMDYIAPEQTENAATVGPRSDLYGLGCTLYFALTGQPPFPGGDARTKIRRHRKELPAALSDLNPLIPADFAAIVHPLLSKRPEDRPASASILRQQLMAWADPLPPPVRPVEAADPQVIAELEADLETTEEPASAWDWMPSVSLAATAGRPGNRTWWAELGAAGQGLALALAGLTLLTAGVLAWWAVRG
jgi:serine/threonine protein kinase